MSGRSHTAGGTVALAHESGFAFSNRSSAKSFIEKLVDLLCALEPRKPAAALAEYADIGLRAAELIFEGRTKTLSGKAQTKLLQSRIGDRVLDLLLGEQPPAWRAAELRLMGIGQIERQLEELEQKKRHLEALLESRR